MALATPVFLRQASRERVQSLYFKYACMPLLSMMRRWSGASHKKTPRRLFFWMPGVNSPVASAFFNFTLLRATNARATDHQLKKGQSLKRAIPEKSRTTSESTLSKHSSCVPSRREWSRSKMNERSTSFLLSPLLFMEYVMVVLVRIVVLHQIYCRACVGPPLK